MASRDGTPAAPAPEEDLKKRSRSVRLLLDRVAVRKFEEARPALPPIKRRIDFGPTLQTARYMYRVVKNEADRKKFFRDPRQALLDPGFRHTAADAELVRQLVEAIVARPGGPSPGDVFDSYSSKETSTHQQWNFDSSGRSAETTKGSIVGENKDFGGFGLVEEIFANPALGETFFPDQPLVTPELVDTIRKRLSPVVAAPSVKPAHKGKRAP
jgi:hypothetical protein